MRPIRESLRGALLVCTTLLVTACAGSTGATIPPGPATPSIDDFPPVTNDAAPGASAEAVAMAAAIGRGVNFGNMLEAPSEGAWGLSVTDEFVAQAAAAGFTAVRLPVRWSNHAGTEAPFTIDPVFMARVEGIVDALLAKGLVVVLNTHHYRQLDGDRLDQGEQPVADAVVDLRFLVIWEQIAQRFRGRSPRLLFELYNEPHGRLNGEPWNVLAARALGVVRRTNPTRVVVIGPTSWNNASDLRLLKLPNDASLIATVHDYEPFPFTHQGAEWVSPVLPLGVTCCSAAQLAQMTAPLDVAKTWAVAKRYPMFVGEFGAYSKADDASRREFNRKMRDAIESRGMTWAYWEFAAGFGVYDPATRAFRQELLASLLGPAAPPAAAPFESEIAVFEAADRVRPPQTGGIVFVGSSSIRLWRDLAGDFSGLPVLNRGFGGSTLPDVIHFAPRVVLPYRPRTVVLYAGDNDLASGRTPAQVADDYDAFVRLVRRALPATRIVFVSIKPSPSRWALVDSVRRANALVAERVRADTLAAFVDLFAPMLGAGGRPRPELFLADSLHMTRAGYALWRERIGPVLR